jgi:hypothetical protein
MNSKIIDVKAGENYLLYLLYNKDEIRLLDMKPYLDFGIFNELKDEKLFNTVKISFDAIEWGNGADLDPEFLFRKSEPVSNSILFNKTDIFQ